jgi:DNA-directed RNA polymerase subunit RPC12/RpoP
VIACPACEKGKMKRRRRTLLEKVRYTAVYYCRDCGYEARLSFLDTLPQLSLYARCPRCGEVHLKTFRKRDRIEGFYRNPISQLQRFLGAPLLYCFHCRLQFYDLRRRVTEDTSE